MRQKGFTKNDPLRRIMLLFCSSVLKFEGSQFSKFASQARVLSLESLTRLVGEHYI